MKIFIDAGHNHSKWNTGAEGNGLREQDITFQIAEKLFKKLNAMGVDIKMSRYKITDVLGTSNNSSVKKRVELANKWGADLFVSIHCNSHALKSANGTEVLVYNKKSEVYSLAENICNNLSNALNLKNRGVKASATTKVLRKTKMSALLIETAFISNINDAQKLKDRQPDFVDAIADAICDYYNIEKRPTATLPESAKYYVEGITHIIEVEPRNIWAVETQCKTNKVPYNNFVNSVFFMNQANGIMYPQGIMVNAGEVICNNPTHGKPVATLIVRGADDVEMKYVSDITKEKDVWFAVSGYGIYPNITALEEGFTGEFTDVMRMTNRPIIGYRKKDNKIVIAVRENSSAARAQQTAQNLKLDFAISLDAGGSTTLKVDNKYKFKGDGRKIYGGLIWS